MPFRELSLTSSPLPWVTVNICCQIIKSTYNWLNFLDSKPGERLKFTESLVSLVLVCLELVYLFIFLKPLETISKQMLTASENLTHPETLSKTFTHGPQWTVLSYLQVASPGAKGRKEKTPPKRHISQRKWLPTEAREQHPQPCRG